MRSKPKSKWNTMAKPIDLDGMSVKELRQLREAIEQAIATRQRTERVELKAKMAALAEEAGLSLEEIFGGRGKGVRGPVAAKYRNPDNPDETWAGRGRMPKWLSAKLEKRGVKIEDFAV